MLQKNASIRIFTSFSGIIFQIVTLFLILNLLDVYQFAVWGVANSIIYIFSVFGQLSYAQNIEKYFPNYNKEDKHRYLNNFIKKIIIFSIIFPIVLYFLNLINYFDKFNAENLYILFTIISFTSLTESLISILYSFSISEKKTNHFDVFEFIFNKFFRLIFFYFILLNNLSVYYLLLANLILRSIFLIKLITNLKILKSFKLYENVNNTKEFKYSIFAFLDKTLYVSFINLLFLVSVNFSENIEISHFSLAILIINNLRPAVDSISSLLPPLISKNIYERKNNFSIFTRITEINSLIISCLIVFSLILLKNDSLSLFITNDYENGIFKIIFTSILASTFRSLYYPSYLEKLYDGTEKKLLLFTIFNQLALTVLYINIYGKYLNNFVLIYIIYEVLNFVFFTHSKHLSIFDFIKNLKFSYLISVFLSILYILDIYYIEIHLLIIFILFIEISIYIKKLFQDKSLL